MSSEIPSSAVKELKDEIYELRLDLKRFIEQSGEEHMQSLLSDIQKNYADLFITHQITDARSELAEHMAHDCSMYDTCYQVFLDFLVNASRLIREGNVTEEVISSYRDQMRELRKKGPYDKCETCFSELYRLFEKQVDLLQSLGIYSRKEETALLADIPDEEVVRTIIDPLASATRFQILKAISVQARTFSDLSHLTDLRGGNLLFHLKKLTGQGMILQRHERGDYIITGKGYTVLKAVRDLYLLVKER